MTDTTHQQPAPDGLSAERLADLRHYWYAVPSRGAEPARTICALLDHIANRDQEIERLRAALGEQTYCASCGVEYPTADQRQIAELQRDLASARAEAQALRERVRTDAIRHYPESGWEACRLCDGEWKRGQPEKHEEGCSAALAAPSAADGPQAICVQCFVVFPISHGEAEWIKEDGVRLLCPECCHDATGIDQWNDGAPSADGGEG